MRRPVDRGAGRRAGSCKGEAGVARRPGEWMSSASSSWSASAADRSGWTPAGTVCWDGYGPGWSGGWRGTPALGKVPPALSPVGLIATSGPATDDPIEGSGSIWCDRIRLQHMSGSRCRPLHDGTVAVEPATRQAAGSDDHTWGGAV